MMARDKITLHIETLLGGEPIKLDYLQQAVREKQERDSMSEKVTASCGIAVDGQEFNALLKRFRHLLESETIRQYDEVNPRTGEYVRDIRELDKMVGVDVGSGESKTGVLYLCDPMTVKCECSADGEKYRFNEKTMEYEKICRMHAESYKES